MAETQKWPTRRATESPSGPLRIVLADDHALVTEGLRSLIDQQPDMVVIDVVNDGDQLLTLWAERQSCHERIDGVVLDLQMPHSGFEVLAALQKRREDGPRILVLTAFADGETIQSVMQLGADGFALKTESPTQTLEAIRQVAEGRLVFPRAARRWMTSGKLSEVQDAKSILSPRERDVLAALAQGKANSDIAEMLVVSENTVRFHLKNIYQKLYVNNRTEATAWYFQNK